MRWTDPAAATIPPNYAVSLERASGRGCDAPHTHTDSISSGTTNYTVTGLSGLSTYSIGIAAGNVFGWSDVISRTIETPPSREQR